MSSDALFDQYKGDLDSIATRLAVDFGDPTEDLRKVTSYLERSRQTGDPDAWKQHFVRESLPKILKAVLKRKYSVSNADAHVVRSKDFLVECSAFLADKVDMEVGSLLCLLDPQQLFYKTYGFPKIPDQKGHLVSSASAGQLDMGWVSTVAIGDSIDAQNDAGGWETVLVTNWSPTLTEIEVQFWSSTNEKRWFSVFEPTAGAYRLAPFGLKSLNQQTDISKVEPMPEVVVPVRETPLTAAAAPTSSVEDGTTPRSEDTESAELWRLGVKQGTLLDSLDRNNTWYQACVMETKLVEADNPIVAAAAVSPAPPASAVHAQASVCLVDAGDQLKQNLHAEKIPTATAASVAVLLGDTLGKVDGAYPMTGVSAVHMEAMEAGGAYAEALPDNEMKVEEVWGHHNDMDVATMSAAEMVGERLAGRADSAHMGQPGATYHTHHRTVVRVAYLGWAEGNDEWIDLDSARLAVLNSKSKGKRGALTVRDEISFLILHDELVAANEANENGKFALLRDHCFLSPYYVEVVSAFASGFKGILKYLRRAPPDPRPVSGYVMNLIQAVGNTAPVLSKPCLESFAPKFIECARAALQNISLAELRLLTVETLEACLGALEAVCVAYRGRSQAMGALIDPLYLNMALTNLTCPYLLNRLGGLKMLSEVISKIQAAREHPRGFKVDRKVTPSGVETIAYRVVPIMYKLSLSEVCQRIVETGAIFMIFKGDNSHESLMARSGEVVKALAMEGQLDPCLVEAVWEAGFISQGAVALKVLLDIVAYMEPDALVPLLAAADSIEPGSISVSHVDVLSSMAARCKGILMSLADAPYADTPRRAHALHVHGQVLERLWCLVDMDASDRPRIDTVVIDRCMGKMEGILNLGVSPLDAQLAHPDFPWSMHWKRCEAVIRRAIQASVANRSTVPALRILQSFIASWPLTLNKVAPGLPIQPGLPFDHPTASHLASYLNESQDIIKIVAEAIGQLKRQFAEQTKGLVTECISSSSGGVARVGKFLALPADVQTKMNEALIGQSQIGYTEQLARCLDFIHAFARFSDDFTIPQVCP